MNMQLDTPGRGRYIADGGHCKIRKVDNALICDESAKEGMPFERYSASRLVLNFGETAARRRPNSRRWNYTIL